MFFFAYLESLKCENDMHMLNDRIGAVMSYAVSCCLTLLSARCSLSQRDPHFTLPHHWVSCNSVVRAHLTRSWRVLGLIPIWGSDFPEFPEGRIVIWFNILRDPWKVFSHKHSTFWQQVATTLLLNCSQILQINNEGITDVLCAWLLGPVLWFLKQHVLWLKEI